MRIDIIESYADRAASISARLEALREEFLALEDSVIAEAGLDAWLQVVRATGRATKCPAEMDGHDCVYFVAAGAPRRIKIGTTQHLPSRLRALGAPALLIAFPGSRRTESMLHQRYDPLRVRHEWFRDEPEIHDCISSVMRSAA